MGVKKRFDGQGSIYQRNGVYQYAYYIQVNGKPKRKYKSLGTKDRKEAEEKARELEVQWSVETQADVIREIARLKKIDVKKILLADVWNLYLESQKRSDVLEGTLEGYEAYWRSFHTWCTENEFTYLNEINDAAAERYCVTLSEKVRAQTFNKHRDILANIFELLGKSAGMPDNPFREINRKSGKGKGRRRLTAEEVSKILDTAEGELHSLIALGLLTALRLKDACLLEWKDVDFNKMEIRCIPNKTRRTNPNKIVHIPIFSRLLTLLKKIEKDKKNEYVLPEMAELYLSNRNRPSKKVGRLFKKCDIKINEAASDGGRAHAVAGFHSLRHTFVSFGSENNVPMSIMQSIVGHGSPAMTELYTHVDVNIARSAFDSDNEEVITNKILELAAGLSPERRMEIIKQLEKL